MRALRTKAFIYINNNLLNIKISKETIKPENFLLLVGTSDIYQHIKKYVYILDWTNSPWIFFIYFWKYTAL